MKHTQYIIHHRKTHLDVEWDSKTILFDTQEEAEELISAFPVFFHDLKNIEIISGIYFIDEAVNYKDIKHLIEEE